MRGVPANIATSSCETGYNDIPGDLRLEDGLEKSRDATSRSRDNWPPLCYREISVIGDLRFPVSQEVSSGSTPESFLEGRSDLFGMSMACLPRVTSFHDIECPYRPAFLVLREHAFRSQ